MNDLKLSTHHEAGILNSLTSKRKEEHRKRTKRQVIVGMIMILVYVAIIFLPR